jgi:enoyl-CoA hydratase/carnithine racemase
MPTRPAPVTTWRLNLMDPETIVALRELMDMLEADPAVKVGVFDSADEEYFIAHFDVARGDELPTDPAPPACPPGLTSPPG